MEVLYLEVIEQMNSAKGLSYKYKLYAFAEKKIFTHITMTIWKILPVREILDFCVFTTFTDEAWELGGMLRFSF